jgi:hypothetical protein
MTTKKTERNFIFEIYNSQMGYNKEASLYYICFSILEAQSFKEHLVYVTASDIDVGTLTIKNFTIEFLDLLTQNTEVRAYDPELFEEIYNNTFDNLYKLIQEEMIAV